MDNLAFWIIGFMIVPIIIVKYYQLRKASKETNGSLKQYLSVERNIWTLIPEVLIYIGLWVYLLISFSRLELEGNKYLSLIHIIPLALIAFGVALLIIVNISKFKPNNFKRQLLSEFELEKKVANSKKSLYFLYSAPLFIGFIIGIEYAFPYDDRGFIGFDVSEISVWRLLVISVVWAIVYALMIACAYYLRKMAEHMLRGDLYGNEPLKYLSTSANLLQVMAFVLMIYSFTEGLLIGHTGISYLLKPIFWLSYFLIFLSLMFKYLSHVLQRAAILKEENDLTI
ncbi:DUF2975 domain-containing protein [Nonlabens marinus]|uniref:DUF2975 domain-containing protein n=1 Tax=Nonlabens marinus S1-08 TaxID=1454201 RepID=W8VWG7_9FLAO|nr:DUF2975 domain-containing protein [Nonlabens marinus]BAO54717.1 hypothetical protein NMS_0708 [Nonlabens marinus S1-08]